MRIERRSISRVDDDVVPEPRKMTKKPSEGTAGKPTLLQILMAAAEKAAFEPNASPNSEISEN